MDAGIISVGTELVTGQCVDTNAAWLSQQLTRRGVQVVRHVTVGDDKERIRDAISNALGGLGLVIITGGLGPTPDDVTRHAIAAAIGQPLEENAEALASLRAMFERWERKLHESNLIQALIPAGCIVLPNARGTASGIGYRRADTRLFALPGVPAEMEAMFEAAVVPSLPAQKRSACARSTRLLCFGISEARLGELLADLMVHGRNPSVGTTASGAVLSVRLNAHGQDESEAERLLIADAAEIHRRLGRVVFAEGEETLQGAVAKLLVQQGMTVATAESCTGGLIAKRLTDIPGSSAYFLRGFVVYANEAKTDLLGVPSALMEAEGTVSESVARAMASGCRSAADTDFALSITGIAGPTGGNPPEKPVGLVYIGLADNVGVSVRRFLLGEHLSRDEIRDRACKTALNMLRLRLLAT
jgi:nicotinamide-nucleotide amidase